MSPDERFQNDVHRVLDAVLREFHGEDHAATALPAMGAVTALLIARSVPPDQVFEALHAFASAQALFLLRSTSLGETIQ